MLKVNKTTRRTRKISGMTLVEVMVAIGVDSIVLLSILLVFATSNRSFVGLGNYVVMEQNSRNALDQMTRDIRRAKNLVSYSTNQLVFKYYGTSTLTYSYDPVARQLTQLKTGEQPSVLLSGCDDLQFSLYSNVPQPGGAFTNTTLLAQGKCISVAWKCSRSILGQKLNSEDMQQALIVIRNQPVL